MRKAAYLATTLIFTGTSLAYAMPDGIGPAAQVLTASEGPVMLVAQHKVKKAKKKSSKSGGGMNMPGMPPGHKM